MWVIGKQIQKDTRWFSIIIQMRPLGLKKSFIKALKKGEDMAEKLLFFSNVVSETITFWFWCNVL